MTTTNFYKNVIIHEEIMKMIVGKCWVPNAETESILNRILPWTSANTGLCFLKYSISVVASNVSVKNETNMQVLTKASSECI
jgi:hypothetical protein